MAPSWQRPEVTLAPSAAGGAAATEDRRLALECGVPFAEHRDTTRWQIVRSSEGLALCTPEELGGMCLSLDVRSGALGKRLRTARRSDPLPRAAGLPRRQARARVVDASPPIRCD